MPQYEPLLQEFTPSEREALLSDKERYDALLQLFPENNAESGARQQRENGILALNGASGAGQSYVLVQVERILAERGMELPRIFLLGTRTPRPGEGHKNPYIFVERVDGGFRDVHNPDVSYGDADIYYCYESRPGAENALLLSDARAALERVMYLETVIPTLLFVRSTSLAGIPAWGDLLKIVYLAAPSGEEWPARLLKREPDRLTNQQFRRGIVGRTQSSIADMELAAENGVPCVLNRFGEADKAAAEILAVWGLS